jgi:hypothetical protein
MTSISNSRWRVAALFLAGTLILSVGCGKVDKNRVPVVPVDGTVSFDGKPLAGAMIVLHPKNGGSNLAPAPRAQVEKDGSFRFTTYEAGDGAPPGEYIATIAWYKLVNQAGDVKAGPNVLPPKYSNPKNSPWQIRVAESGTRLSPVQIRR